MRKKKKANVMANNIYQNDILKGEKKKVWRIALGDTVIMEKMAHLLY